MEPIRLWKKGGELPPITPSKIEPIRLWKSEAPTEGPPRPLSEMIYSGQIGEWTKPYQPDTAYSGLWKEGYIPVPVKKPPEELSEWEQIKKSFTTSPLDPKELEIARKGASIFVQNFIPTKIGARIMGKDIAKEYAGEAEEFSQQYPVTATVIGGVAQLLNYISAAKLLSPLAIGEKIARLPGGLRNLHPILTRMVARGGEFATIGGLVSGIDEALNQSIAEKPSAMKIAQEAGKGALYLGGYSEREEHYRRLQHGLLAWPEYPQFGG